MLVQKIGIVRQRPVWEFGHLEVKKVQSGLQEVVDQINICLPATIVSRHP